MSVDLHKWRTKDLTLCLDTEHLMHTKQNTSVNTQIQNKLKQDNSGSNKRIISLLYLKSRCFDICVTFEKSIQNKENPWYIKGYKNKNTCKRNTDGSNCRYNSDSNLRQPRSETLSPCFAVSLAMLCVSSSSNLACICHRQRQGFYGFMCYNRHIHMKNFFYYFNSKFRSGD